MPEIVINIRNIFIGSMRHFLRSSGYQVQAPARLRGDSGAEHTVDLFALGPDGTKIIVDLWISPNPADEGVVISTYAKVLDTNPTQSYLAVMPRATQAARELAESYRIHLLEGISAEDLVARGNEILLTKSV